MAAKQTITNGDRIRSMSDDELAEFFEEVEVDQVVKGDFCRSLCRFRGPDNGQCDDICKYYNGRTFIQGNKKIWKDWLRMKAEGGT
jgi:hypothetical protein